MRAFIGLGGNQGDPAATFASAVAELRAMGHVVRVSSLYASAPRELMNQPEFLNAVLELETELEPGQLLFNLKRLEVALGGTRGTRYGPRVIDLDILSFDGRCVEDMELDLIVPHPRLVERRFALEPLAELDPGCAPGATAPTCGPMSPWPTCCPASPTRTCGGSGARSGRTEG